MNSWSAGHPVCLNSLMHSKRHAVFVSAGKLPEELRHVLLKRHGQPQTDMVVRAPRLLATFDSAADAERVSGQLQRQGFKTLMTGPEQPPAREGWLVVRSITRKNDGWLLTTNTHDLILTADRVETMSSLSWRPEKGSATRAVLLELKDPTEFLFFDGANLAPPQLAGPNLEGLKRLSEFLEQLGAASPKGFRTHSRQFTSTQLFDDDLDDDALEQALLIVHRLDTVQAPTPGPLHRRPANTSLIEFTALARVSSGVMLLTGLGALATSLIALVPLVWLNLTAAVETVVLAALGVLWGSLRVQWAYRVLGERALPFISGIVTKGLRISPAWLVVDLVLLATIGHNFSEGVAATVLKILFGLQLVATLPTLGALVEQTREENDAAP